MNEEDAKKLEESRQATAELREWMIRFDVNQDHQTRLLEQLVLDVKRAIDSADEADDKAEKALTLATQTKQEFDEYRKEESVKNRWLVGLIVTSFITIGIALLNVYL